MSETEGRSIFLADDNPDNLKVLSDILEESGYSIRASLSGEEMLESIELKMPDLIILDVHMSNMDGYEVCTKLKSQEHTKDIPVIYCSALDEAFNVVKGFDVGGVDYITKPFHAQEVVARVRTHIELKEKQLEIERNLEYLKNAQQHLIETEKMTSIGILMAGIAHQINNPINYIINSLEAYQTDFSDIKRLLGLLQTTDNYQTEEFEVSLKQNLEETDYPFLIDEMDKLFTGVYSGACKVHEIVKSLRVFSTSKDEEKQIVSIETELERAILIISNRLDQEIELERNWEVSAEVFAQPGRLSQVFLQLMQNSLEALEKDKKEGTGRISLSIEKAPERDTMVRIRMYDTGCGMSKEELERAKEPFVTSKKLGRGTGLGLTTVHYIIQDLGGEMEINSTPGTSTEINVLLPVRNIVTL